MSNNCKEHSVPCGCKDTGILTPPPCGDGIECPDSNPCSETFDTDCIFYTGEPILCGVDEIVGANTSVTDALTQLIAYFCTSIGGGVIPGDILCGLDVVVPLNTTYEDAFSLITAYFCTAIEQLPDSDVILFRHLGMTPSPVVIPATAYLNTIMPNDNDGIKITFLVNVTADSVGKIITVQNDGFDIFVYTCQAGQTGVLKFEILGTRNGLDMVGNAIAQNVTNNIGGTFAAWTFANWFTAISNSITIGSDGGAPLEIGEITVERLLSI